MIRVTCFLFALLWVSPLWGQAIQISTDHRIPNAWTGICGELRPPPHVRNCLPEIGAPDYLAHKTDVSDKTYLSARFSRFPQQNIFASCIHWRFQQFNFDEFEPTGFVGGNHVDPPYPGAGNDFALTLIPDEAAGTLELQMNRRPGSEVIFTSPEGTNVYGFHHLFIELRHVGSANRGDSIDLFGNTNATVFSGAANPGECGVVETEYLELVTNDEPHIFQHDPFIDLDGDGVINHSDNCIERVETCDNDTEGPDGFFDNACDGDFNNDGAVNAADNDEFGQYLSNGGPSPADMNCDGATNAADVDYYTHQLQRGVPGPGNP